MNTPLEREIIGVRWGPGLIVESGFASRDEATRFVDKICKPAAPDKSYTILNTFVPTKRKLEP